MNYKKDSKKAKTKYQVIQVLTDRNFMSPAPKRNPPIDPQFNPMNLRDLSPYPVVYTTCHTPNHINFSNTELVIIQTPAGNTFPKMSYLQQIDQGHHPISGVIDWQNGDQEDQDYIQSKIQDEESDILEMSDDESKKQEQNKINQESIKKNQDKRTNLQMKNGEVKLKKEINRKVVQVVGGNVGVGGPKKVFCNCKKTKCLKLYCDCFRINQTCDGCNCVGCHNLGVYEEERNNAMLSLMDRNPQAFKPKIDEQQHAKGCHCKKSNCLKKYCQCFQAGLKCGVNCKCEECRNKIDEYDDRNDENGNSEVGGVSCQQYGSNNQQNKEVEVQKERRGMRLSMGKNRKMEEWAVFT